MYRIRIDLSKVYGHQLTNRAKSRDSPMPEAQSKSLGAPDRSAHSDQRSTHQQQTLIAFIVAQQNTPPAHSATTMLITRRTLQS